MVIEDLVISEESSVRDVLTKMDATGYRTLLVTCDEKLKAIITDYDIRRFMISEGNLEKKVKDLANYNPTVLHIEDTIEPKEVMLKKRISVIPIVDSEGRVERLEFDNGKIIYRKSKNDTKIVIMAGGKGKRLQPLTDILPKPLIPVGSKTILEHIIDDFAVSGFYDFNIIINYKKEIIKAFFSNNVYDNKYDINITFYEENDYLGTGGGLRLLTDTLDSTFVLSNCDILVKVDLNKLISLHKIENNTITVVCAPKKINIPYGAIKTDDEDRIIEMQEKPSYECLINTGLYIVEPSVINLIKHNEAVDFTDLIERCMDNGYRVGTYKIAENGWQDMGEMSKLMQMDGNYKVIGM
jgi:dTDP-glucose pyrophosphorylase